MSKTILLVEDEAIIALSGKMSLEKYGYSVSTVNSGEKAVKMAAGDSGIDLILMDIDLGKGIDGTETAALILKDRDIPIVFLSSHTEPDIVARTEKITSYGYVVKNSSITVLDASIKMAFKLFDTKINEQRKEEALVQSERNYFSLIDNASDMIVRFDTGFHHVFLNSAVERQLGIPVSLLLGKTLSEIGTPMDQVDFVENSLRKVLESDEPLEVEQIGQKCFQTRIVPEHDKNGKIESLLAITRDITERKRMEEKLRDSEERYRKAQQVGHVGSWEYDLKNDTFWGSDEGKRIYGFNTSNDIFTAEKVMKCVIEKERVNQAMINLIEKNEPYDIEFEIIPFNSSEKRTLNSIAGLARDDEGNPVKVIGVLHDITERKLAEDTMKKLLAEKDLILKEVHHRIKNNMGAIFRLLLVQSNDSADPQAGILLRDAGSRVHSIALLYDKLYQSADYRNLQMKDYLPSLVDEIVGNFPNSDSVKIEKKIDNFVLDAKRLQPLGIIINELLTNTMKYAFVGRAGGLITVSASLADNRVIVGVEDNGNGMPPSVDFENSTGFGLILVENLVKQLNGTIRIERGSGTKIVLEFLK